MCADNNTSWMNDLRLLKVTSQGTQKYPTTGSKKANNNNNNKLRMGQKLIFNTEKKIRSPLSWIKYYAQLKKKTFGIYSKLLFNNMMK